jgi:hypothetical protein
LPVYNSPPLDRILSIESSPHTHILFLEDPFQRLLNDSFRFPSTRIC